MEKNFNFKDIINAVERYWQENEFDFKENENPVVIFLAGQSASGKSQLKSEIDSNFLIVDVDDFRKYHPDYFKLYKKLGKESAKYTHDFASEVADELIKKGADLKINILIDGTLKNFEKPFERASYLKEKNYICEIRAVVTKPEKSVLANLLRYEDFIQKEFERKWTKEEYSKFLSDADHLIKKMFSRKAEDIEIEIAKAEIKELAEKIKLETVKKQKNKLKSKEKGTKLLRK